MEVALFSQRENRALEHNKALFEQCNSAYYGK